MTPEELAKLPAAEKIKVLEDVLAKRTAPPTGGAASSAFVGASDIPGETVEKPPNPLLGKERSLLNDVPAMGAGMVAEEATRRVVSPVLAKAGPLGKVGAVLAPPVAAGAAAAGAELTRRSAMGEDDSFTSAINPSLYVGAENMLGSGWGTVLTKFSNVGRAMANPRINPENLETANELKDKMRELYERTAGTKLAEDRRAWWHPFRRNTNIESELDNSDAVEKLRKAGYDPEMARKIALHGPAGIGDIADNTVYRWAQNVIGNLAPATGMMGRWRRTRSAMLQDVMKDMGGAFGEALPPEDWGQALNAALNNKFESGVMLRRTALNGLRQQLPDDWKMTTGHLKRGLDPMNPADRIMLSLPKVSTDLTDFTEVRQSLQSVAMDQGLDEATRQRAGALAKRMDKRLMGSLPDEAQQYYKQWQGVDDEHHKQNLDTAFVKGIAENAAGRELEWARGLLKSGNTKNLKRLETALGKDTPEMNKYRAAVMEAITEGATSIKTTGTEAMNPAKMRQQLSEYKGLGKAYMEDLLGKDVVKNYERYADTMDRFNQTTRASQVGSVGMAMGQSYVGWEVLKDLGLSAKDAAMVGALITIPRYVAKAVTNPETAHMLDRMTKSAMTGKDPARVRRLAGRLMEHYGVTPDQVLEDVGWSVNPLEKFKRGLKEGKLELPSTGSGMADAVLNPAGAIANLTTGQ